MRAIKSTHAYKDYTRIIVYILCTTVELCIVSESMTCIIITKSKYKVDLHPNVKQFYLPGVRSF